jgi:membrane-associated protein
MGRRAEKGAFTQGILKGHQVPVIIHAMDTLTLLMDFILHIDRYLEAFVQAYGVWVYAILFLVVFVETGLVVMPFLPGDSLLFVVGAMAGAELLSLPWVLGLLTAAAILGDQCNYLIGRHFGQRLLNANTRWFNRQAYDQAHAFYERYGNITIVLARFLPFIRTFAPFVAGVADMNRRRFTLFNVLGAFIWVWGICIAGYMFGHIGWVKANLDKIIWAMILIPGLMAVWGAWRTRR